MKTLLACLLSLWLGPWAWTEVPPPLILGAADVQPLAGHLMALETPSGATFAEVLQASAQGRFRTIPGFYDGGYRLREVWLRFDLRQPAAGPVPTSWLEVTPASLEEINLFLPIPGGGYWEFRGGASIPFSARPLNHRDVAFPICDGGQPLASPVATCFLRVHSRTPLVVQPILRNTKPFIGHLEREALMFGAMFGVGILVLAWNLLYWFKLRDLLHLQYAAYLASMLAMLAGLEGYLGLLVLPERPGLVNLIARLGVATQPWLATTLFCSMFGLNSLAPRFDRTYRSLGAGLTLFALGFTLTGHYFGIAAPLNGSLLAFTVLNMVLALALALRWGGEGWLYLLAFGPYMIGAIAHLGRNVGLLKVGFLAEHGLHLGVFFHFCLMNLPLAERHRRLKRERDQAMAQALELSERQERELEGKVEERTRQVRDEQARTTLALARERQATVEQREFISMVSHEFRTPLAIIDGAAQVASLSSATSPEDVRRQTAAIRRSTHRLLDLMNTWLAQDRITSGLTAMNPQPVALESFLGEIVKQASEHPPAHKLTLALDGLAPIYAFDRELVRTALRNLLENAIKYSPKGGAIQLQGSLRGDNLCLGVIDHGLGIPADQMERATTRFFRGRNTENIPGVGLGLHLVRVIAELHGGKLELESQEGAGTAAWIILPARSSTL